MENKKENKEIDSKEKALDYAILDYLRDTTNPNLEGGYEIGGRHYDNYMSNDEWKKFLREMSPLHIDMYNKGRGGELEEKRGRYGLYPPKMASFGSSSRFIYELSKEILGFVFEEKLSTFVGGKANLDGFLPKEDENIYVETKCREIYGSHKKVEISDVYKEVYKSLKKTTKENFDYKTDTSKKEGYSKYTFKYNGKDIEHFDIKQLICHFLGIAADYLTNKLTKKIKFIYLIFDPREVEDKIDKKYNEKLIKIYNETIEEIKSIDMCRLFEAVWEYQKGNKDMKYNVIKQQRPKFDFVVCSQYNYKEYIK